MKNVVLHKDGSVSYRSPISQRWIRRTDLPCAGDLGGLTVAEQCRIMDHLWLHCMWSPPRVRALRYLGAAIARQREHKGE